VSQGPPKGRRRIAEANLNIGKTQELKSNGICFAESKYFDIEQQYLADISVSVKWGLEGLVYRRINHLRREQMTTLDKNGFTFVDGVGGINMVDGVVRIDLVAVSRFEQDKAVTQRAGGLAISLTGFVKMHEQVSNVIEDMLQKGLLQRRDNATQPAVPDLQKTDTPKVGAAKEKPQKA